MTLVVTGTLSTISVGLIKLFHFHIGSFEPVLLSLSFLGSLGLSFWALFYRWASIVLEDNPVLWLIKFLTIPRILILAYWALMLVLGAFGIGKLLNTGPGKKRRNAKDAGGEKNRVINMRRKYFHFLAIVMFAPNQMMHLSFTIAFSLFILLEFIRILNIIYLGSYWIEMLFKGFIDPKDEGILVVSHVYLLFGCASSVWLANEFRDNFAGLAGVLILGVGDSTASIVGKMFGRFKWHSLTNKTIEGTIAFFGAVLMAMFVIETASRASFQIEVNILK
ncbi:hypothetical protein HK098_004253 [Nowakowskiella sp. JEL0407]|nr:hypothetical protein HK098_004253 [Nowakowskiella sp. JEL0407]